MRIWRDANFARKRLFYLEIFSQTPEKLFIFRAVCKVVGDCGFLIRNGNVAPVFIRLRSVGTSCGAVALILLSVIKKLFPFTKNRRIIKTEKEQGKD